MNRKNLRVRKKKIKIWKKMLIKKKMKYNILQ